MQTAGMMIEYNPMHSGHLHLVEQIRARMGADTAVVGVMSGNFVQRGDVALLRGQARARAAVESGVDLVLELPLSWALASAERFADGGIQILMATGVVDVLAFGSECGDTGVLERLAAALTAETFPDRLREELLRGDSFAAARQRAVAAAVGEEAERLSRPNDLLGVEYCKSLRLRGAAIRPMAVPRTGAAHDGPLRAGEHPSATAIRALLRAGRRAEALALLPPAMRRAYEAEEAAGRAPVFLENCQRAVLARLRSMDEEAFAALDQGREGLYRRLYAARTAPTLEEVLAAAKTKRYAYARLRRMVLWAYLGLTGADFPAEVPYLRPLAANERGRKLLAQMRERAILPILTKPANVRRSSEAAQRVFELEARAADLYALAYPDLSAAAGGTIWRESPVML